MTDMPGTIDKTLVHLVSKTSLQTSTHVYHAKSVTACIHTASRDLMTTKSLFDAQQLETPDASRTSSDNLAANTPTNGSKTPPQYT